jgi:S-adenosylmethionine-diacylglycerol 3-amino-3-carboxypropyl transferase
MIAHAPSLLDRFHQRFFNTVYARSLLYNACWEDPALDRVALGLGGGDTLMMITSAGCNALDYALLGPRRIHAIDANPRQNALLELKLAGIRRLDFADFFALFGEGRHPGMRELYHDTLRADLSPFARGYWDARLHWFSGQGWRSSLYYHGLSGLVARTARQFLATQPRLRRAFDALLEADDLATQRELYDREIEPRLWNAGTRWLVSRRSTMSLLGVPAPQARAVADSHSGGIAGFIGASLRAVFRDLPMRDNYFWAVYLRGAYTRVCCPEYLKPDNFLALKGGLAERIVPHTCTVTEFLAGTSERISRFVMLDHMDWMSSYHPQALAEEWQALLAAASPGARILFRSASPEAGFLTRLPVTVDGRPRPIGDLLRFDAALAAELHARDRVHTYASFHIADLAH